MQMLSHVSANPLNTGDALYLVNITSSTNDDDFIPAVVMTNNQFLDALPIHYLNDINLQNNFLTTGSVAQPGARPLPLQ